MVKLGRTVPSGRFRHGKRLPQDSDVHGDDADSGIATELDTIIGIPTIVNDVTSTPTVVFFTVTDTSTVVTTATSPGADNSPFTRTTASSSAYSSGRANDTPNTEMSDAAAPTDSVMLSSSSSSSGLPVGAVVGIVLAVILLAAASVFWFRRRSIASRLKKQQLTKQQQNAPSFLFIEPKEPVKVPPFSVTNVNTLQPYRSRDPGAPAKTMLADPGGKIQPAHNGLSYIPHSTPRLLPAAGIHDAHTTHIIPANRPRSGVSTHDLPSPASPSLIASPSPPKPAETAKVRATFIPTLPDELTISSGEMVRIHVEYDDGWCLCSNARGEMGMVPLECLDRASQLPQERPVNRGFRKSVRVSSLVATPRSPYGGNALKASSGGNIPKSP
ncbi:hypothetical protein J132_09689 [Termitomyces sp. J132]|nr:hypothetical protein H2248_009168 [Termitomyces sp. 'cryptogamus']KNZ73787.1 hypothetical protein J132_09689 [Termitomyces sp. J132]